MQVVLRVENTESALAETLGIGGLIQASGGLTIGRAEDNGLVLPDHQQIISNYHCSIECVDGRFILTDRSSSGTYLNQQALPRETPVTLKAGDVIQIGCYRIEVVAADPTSAVKNPAEPDWHTAGPVGELSFPDVVETKPSLSGGTTTRREKLLLSEPDGDFLPAPDLDARLDELSGVMRSRARPADVYPNQTQDQRLIFAPPKPEAIPENWDLVAELGTTGTSVIAPDFIRINIGGSLDAAPALPRPKAPQEPSRSMGPGEPDPENETCRSAIAAFFSACGLSLADIGIADITTVMDRAGRMLLHSIAGLHAILAAREPAKRGHGIERTTVARPGDNPLSCMLDASEALHAALCLDTRGFLHGEAAVEQALADIRAHEVFMLATLQKALLSIHECLSPTAIEKALGSTRSLWPRNKKARNWDAYRRIFDGAISSIENDTLRSFGADVARAYREAVADLDEPPDRARKRPLREDKLGSYVD
ncbi:type VI secretion system-associated FHA domain protein TagH [Mesorhizobium sp. BHbsci]